MTFKKKKSAASVEILSVFQLPVMVMIEEGKKIERFWLTMKQFDLI